MAASDDLKTPVLAAPQLNRRDADALKLTTQRFDDALTVGAGLELRHVLRQLDCFQRDFLYLQATNCSLIGCFLSRCRGSGLAHVPFAEVEFQLLAWPPGRVIRTVRSPYAVPRIHTLNDELDIHRRTGLRNRFTGPSSATWLSPGPTG